MSSEVPLIALPHGRDLTGDSPEHSEVKAAESPLLQNKSPKSPMRSFQAEETKSTGVRSPRSADDENVMRYADEPTRASMLISAASRNQISRMKKLLEQGVSPDSADYDQRSALHIACAEGNDEAAMLLLEQGATLNVRDRFGLTPLDEAIKSRNDTLVGELLDKGGEVSKPSSESSLLAIASQTIEDALRLAELILKAKVDPNCTDTDGRTPLHFAAAESNVPMAELLLKNGADPSKEDRWKNTPMMGWKSDIAKLFDGNKTREEVVHMAWSTFSFVFAALQCVIIILMFSVTTYNEGSRGGDEAIENSHMDLYPHFQDVNVMVFIGFGYLMTFLRKHIFNSVGLTFMVGAMVVEWHMLVNGFFEQAFCRYQMGESECAHVWELIPLGLHNMLLADFCAASVLITYGAILGKVSPAKLCVMAFFETIFYVINEMFGKALGVTDIGGTMVIHMFGAYFGMAFSLANRSKKALDHEHNSSGYHSDAFAMIGTFFLFLYWPSFNSAPSLDDAQQQRTVLNTFLSICASCFCAFITSHVARKELKFCMVDVQNSTLAGGVAMGACADLLITPGAAVSIGSIAGVVSVLGYVYVTPFLERTIGYHDTCGVNNLHGMPSIIGGFSAVIAVSFASEATYGPTQLGDIFPVIAHHGRTARQQVEAQVAFIFVTLGWSLLTGALTGFLTKTCGFLNVDDRVLFSDEHDWEVPGAENPYHFDDRGDIDRTAHGDLAPGIGKRLAALESKLALMSKTQNSTNQQPGYQHPGYTQHTQQPMVYHTGGSAPHLPPLPPSAATSSATSLATPARRSQHNAADRNASTTTAAPKLELDEVERVLHQLLAETQRRSTKAASS